MTEEEFKRNTEKNKSDLTIDVFHNKILIKSKDELIMSVEYGENSVKTYVKPDRPYHISDDFSMNTSCEKDKETTMKLILGQVSHRLKRWLPEQSFSVAKSALLEFAKNYDLNKKILVSYCYKTGQELEFFVFMKDMGEYYKLYNTSSNECIVAYKEHDIYSIEERPDVFILRDIRSIPSSW